MIFQPLEDLRIHLKLLGVKQHLRVEIVQKCLLSVHNSVIFEILQLVNGIRGLL